MPNVIEIKETFCGQTYVWMDGQTFDTGIIRSTLTVQPNKVFCLDLRSVGCSTFNVRYAY